MNDTKYQVVCGFFDAINKDREYSAEQMNRPYKRLVSNGVFATPYGTPSADLQVLATSNGMNVTVKAGEGLFGDKWFENPSDLTVTINSNTDLVSRVDSIIAQVDNTQNGRVGNIVYRQGTASSNPQPPAINTEDNITEYRIANIRIEPTTTNITQDLITDLRGSAECPWVTHLIWQVDTSTLYEQYRAAYQKYYDDETEAFNAFMSELTDQLSVNTNIVKYESHYTTSSDDENTIPINISTYNKNKDVLLVRINRLFASENIDYIISDDGTNISLTKSLLANQNIDFIVLQSLVVGDTATVLQKIQELQSIIDNTKLVNNDGEVKISVTGTNNVLDAFKTAGIGFHTMQAATNTTGVPMTGNYRLFGHLTDNNNGWIIGLKSDGAIYENYLNNGTWQGWKTLYEKTLSSLYTSETGALPNANVEINPTKKLSDCAHGWQLVFCGYSDTSGSSDQYIQTVNIPKSSHKSTSWNGETVTFQLVYAYNSTSGDISSCVKSFNVYNDKIVSTSINDTGNSRNIALKAIYEY